jgi:hypothetical protein
MTDPLDSLRTPITPVDPDPGFAARLRTPAWNAKHCNRKEPP